MSYEFWKQSLAGTKPKMFVDDPQLGFYRRGVYTKEPNKRAKRVGWMPVAIYSAAGVLTAQVGCDGEAAVISDRDKINELWSYCAAYPITEEVYRAVAERGEPWPDSHESPLDDIKAPGAAKAAKAVIEANMSPAEKIAAEIRACQELLPKYATIESDEQSSKARSLQNRFLDLRGEAKKHYEAANRPLLDQQKALRAIWNPLQDEADAASVALRTAMGRWEDTKREAARRAAEAAEKARREHEEAAAKAAAANQPAPAPPPEPEKPNTPPPASQIRGGAGRAASVRVETIVTDVDVMKVAEQMKDHPDLKKCLMDLATRAIRAGIPVPGATTEERSVVR